MLILQEQLRYKDDLLLRQQAALSQIDSRTKMLEKKLIE